VKAQTVAQRQSNRAPEGTVQSTSTHTSVNPCWLQFDHAQLCCACVHRRPGQSYNKHTWRGILLVRTGSSTGGFLKPKYEPVNTSGTDTPNQRKLSANNVLKGTAPLAGRVATAYSHEHVQEEHRRHQAASICRGQEAQHRKHLHGVGGA